MKRPHYLKAIHNQFRIHPVCALLGPRQVGKTTLAKMYLDDHLKERVAFFDLENPLHISRLEQPLLALSQSPDFIIIDEIQRRPELFPILRVLADDSEQKKRFLVLGSASRELIRQSSETLAGRIGYIEVHPFSLNEIENTDQLWLRGGLPRAYLAENSEDSYLWKQAYITTFLEQDIPNLGIQIPPQQLRRFWLMLAHYHGQIFNASELGRSFGISDHTVRRYVDILIGTFMIRQLQPWFENIGKRQVKSPKIYFKDSGLLHTLLGVKTEEQLHLQPKLGALWEGFALEQIIRLLNLSNEECYFWATQSGAELDLMILKNGKRIGFEFKYVDAPKITPSMRIALSDLSLDHLYCVFPGKETFPLAENMTAIGLATNNIINILN